MMKRIWGRIRWWLDHNGRLRGKYEFADWESMKDPRNYLAYGSGFQETKLYQI